MNNGRRRSVLEAEAHAVAARAGSHLGVVKQVPPNGPRSSSSLDPQVGRDLLQRRIITLFGFIDDQIAGDVIAKLIAIGDSDHEVKLVVDSPGGIVTSGFAIVDAMQGVRSPIATQCIGRANSMAAVVLAAGEMKRRSVFPRARIMVHQPFDCSDGERSLLDVEWAREEIASFLASRCDKTVEQVSADLERERSFSANEALAYGIVDAIELAGQAWVHNNSEEPRT
ncbi:ATP-dependent Clp protease proteolytic subunit [Desulfobulbus sp. AH-315-M07]|nr:ATP-dependent Clp protease proteolytic subunit [Desulfobulbus sp. AH-315-M07]